MNLGKIVKRTRWVWVTFGLDLFMILLLLQTCLVLSSGFAFLPWYEPSGIQFLWNTIVLVPYLLVFILLVPLRKAQAATFSNLLAPLMAILILAPWSLGWGIGPSEVQLVVSLVIISWVLVEMGLIWHGWFDGGLVGSATTGDAA